MERANKAALRFCIFFCRFYMTLWVNVAAVISDAKRRNIGQFALYIPSLVASEEMNVVTIVRTKTGSIRQRKRGSERKREQRQVTRFNIRVFAGWESHRSSYGSSVSGTEEFITYACVTRLWLISHPFLPRTTNSTLADYYVSYPVSLGYSSRYWLSIWHGLFSSANQAAVATFLWTGMIWSNSGWT